MGKFNSQTKIAEAESESVHDVIQNNPDFTRNFEGGAAYNIDKYTELYTRVATCLVGEKKFYKEIENGQIVAQNQDKKILKLVKEIAKENPEFLLKLAVFARQHLYLRSIPILLLAECSLIKECQPYVRKYTPEIIRRADELTETVAYLISKIGQLGDCGLNKVDPKPNPLKIGKGSLPLAIKKGLADAFSNFDAYQLAKYNRDGVVKLRDVLRLVHPKPQDKTQSDLFKDLARGTLKSPETWETITTVKGSNKETWEEAVQVMPIFATLRNLRNLLKHEIGSKYWKIVYDRLSDENVIKNSKLFPFRFLSAYREIEDDTNPEVRDVMEYLEKSMDISAANIPHLKGTTAVFADNSASMTSTISGRSKVRHVDIANVNMALADKISDKSICGIFGVTFAVKNFGTRSGVLANANSIINGEVGHATNAYLAIKYLREHDISVDRIFIFSDAQCYDSHSSHSGNDQYSGDEHSLYEQLILYKRHVNPNVYLYSFDTSGYGTAQIPQSEPNTIIFAGWSDKVLHLVKIFEEEKKTAIDTINAITPRGKRSSWKGKKVEKEQDKEDEEIEE